MYSKLTQLADSGILWSHGSLINPKSRKGGQPPEDVNIELELSRHIIRDFPSLEYPQHLHHFG